MISVFDDGAGAQMAVAFCGPGTLDLMLRIGRVEIRNPVVVAPMSGITDRPFRRMAAELGAGPLCTEMPTAVALVRQGPQPCELTPVWPDAHPLTPPPTGPAPVSMAA